MAVRSQNVDETLQLQYNWIKKHFLVLFYYKRIRHGLYFHTLFPVRKSRCIFLRIARHAGQGQAALLSLWVLIIHFHGQPYISVKKLKQFYAAGYSRSRNETPPPPPSSKLLDIWCNTFSLFGHISVDFLWRSSLIKQSNFEGTE